MKVPGGGCGQEYCVQSCMENVIRTATETGGSGDTGASCNIQHTYSYPLMLPGQIHVWLGGQMEAPGADGP